MKVTEHKITQNHYKIIIVYLRCTKCVYGVASLLCCIGR